MKPGDRAAPANAGLGARELLLAGLGIGAIAWLIRDDAGVGTLLQLGDTARALLWILPLHVINVMLDGGAWWLLLRGAPGERRRQPPGFALTAWIALVRDAAGTLLPVCRVGGDVLGVRLIAPYTSSWSFAAASVISEVGLHILTQCAFWAAGLALLATHSDLLQRMPEAIAVGYTVIAATAATGVLLVLGQSPLPRRRPAASAVSPTAANPADGNRAGDDMGGGTNAETAAAKDNAPTAHRRGALTRLADWMFGRMAERIAGGAQAIQADLHRIRSQHGRLLAAAVAQLAGIAVGSMETWLILLALNHPLPLVDAMAMEATTQAVRSVVAVVPAGLGVQEACLAALASMYGMSSSVGLGVSLLKRARELLLGLPALASWAWWELSSLRVSART
jgi:hypothetical protein